MSDLMRQKALRLPLMLIGLMVMVGVIQFFRPHTTVVSAPPRPYRDASTVTMVETTTSLVTNTARPSLPLNMQQANSWTLDNVAAITKTGSTTVLIFTDGSSRSVTPALLKQLPSILQTRVSYDRRP
jgi:hypothetical protein